MKSICLLISFLFLTLCIVTAQTPEQLKSFLPIIDGWVLSDQTEVFDEDNLFDRINGAAPLFIENNFIEMTALEYTKDNEYITIQAYRHASPEDAFGMYASERSSDLQYYPIGGEAQGDNNHLYFFAGNIYVKMWSNATENVAPALQTIGNEIAEKIDANASYPVTIKAFPETNLEPYSIAYITANYIGHEFLRSVYTAKYNIQGQPVQAFIIDAKTPDGAKEILDKYFTFTKQSLEYTQGSLLIKDRYNGDIPAIWKGQYIVGLFNENGEELQGSEELLNTIVRSL